jgi:hypothetical protein
LRLPGARKSGLETGNNRTLLPRELFAGRLSGAQQGRFMTRLKLRNLILLLAGIALVCLSLAQAAIGLSVLRYVKTSGVVLQSHVEHIRGGAIDLHKPVVKYRCLVGDNELVSAVLSPFALSGEGRSNWANKVIAKYPQHARCIVYYDPRNPASAALQLSPSTRTIGVYGLGMLIGCLVIWRQIRSLRMIPQGSRFSLRFLFAATTFAAMLMAFVGWLVRLRT